MKILLASPRGFCAGVNRAVETLSALVRNRKEPIWALHEIVHNIRVVSQFREMGVQFVDSVDEVPEGGTLLFSAHGISPQIRQAAEKRALHTIDATCPLVARVHQLALQYALWGYRIFYIGHAGHQEVIGTLGEAPEQMTLISSIEDVETIPDPSEKNITYLMQTTLSSTESEKIVAALRKRFPLLIEPSNSGICFATRHRQDAVRRLLPEADTLIVIGSRNSSNSRRLAEIGLEADKRTFLADRITDLAGETFSSDETILLTAGASAPEELVRQSVEWFQQHYQAVYEERVIHQENITFKKI